MPYVDAETGYKIREINFDNRDDVKLWVRELGVFFKDAKNQGADLSLPPLPDQLNLPLSIGWIMRATHLRLPRQPKLRCLAILKASEPRGCAVVFSGHDIFSAGDEVYPIILVGRLDLRITLKELTDMYHTLARMMKAEGYTKIYCQTIFNHPIGRLLRTKRKIGNHPHPPEPPMKTLWEMDI